MKRFSTLLAVPLLAGLMFVTGCDNDDEPAPAGTPTNTVPPVNTATRTVALPTATRTTAATAVATNTTAATAVPTATSTPEATATDGGPTSTPTELPPDPTATPTGGGEPIVCGNEVTQTGEECDDGNNYGGDGCAANCTFESDVTLEFGTGTTTQSSSTVQTGLFALVLNITGKQVVTTGKPRTEESIGADGFTNFLAGEAPTSTVTIKNQEDGIGFIDPIVVPGLVCACIRGIQLNSCGGRPVFPGNQDPNNGTACTVDPTACDGSPDGECIPAFGPDVSGAGRIGCVDGIDQDFISYTVAADSLTGDVTLTNNGPANAPGTTYNLSYTAIGTIMDSGTCSIDDSDPRKGPDGIPCTDDDPAESRGTPSVNLQTTGTAQANVLNVNNTSNNIKAGVNCGAAPCITSSTGNPVTCENLAAGNPGGLCLASAFASLDQPTTGDIAVPAKFCALAR